MLKKLITCISLFILVGTATAADYGSTDFDASGSTEAHPVFIKGLLQLHSFEYEDARNTFQQVQQMDPDFYMAYWGEALTHKQQLWSREDLDAGRAALNKLAATAEQRLALAPTERERAYMASVNRLFSDEGTELEIETDYAKMLADIYARWPDDLDAGALTALAILTTSHDGREFDKFMRAAAITEEILDKAPRHPGALHYNIHSYDDPVHAPLGLRAARIYAEVAPNAVHALHMPAHIFLALGDFEGTRDLNRRSFEVARSRSESTGALFTMETYHSFGWLFYALVQLHDYDQARELLAYLQQRMAQGDKLAHGQLATARAYLVLESGDWDDPSLEIAIEEANLMPFELATEKYIRARQAIEAKNYSLAGELLASITVPEKTGAMARLAVPKLLHDIGVAQLIIAQGDVEAGIQQLMDTARYEQTLSPFIGPPVSVLPAGEAAGDALRAAGRDAQALEYYNMTLERAVNKTRARLAVEAIVAEQG